jgi:prophage antirepressor-like protein
MSKKTNSKNDGLILNDDTDSKDALTTGILQTFNFDLIKIRIVDRDGEVWFVAADVCAALDVVNPTHAVKRLDEDERSSFKLGRQGEVIIISESGLYSLVLSSRKAQAKTFKRWVTHDVLPTIRKTGSYKVPSQKNIEPKEYRTILARITNLTSKITKIKDAMDHRQTWLEITVLCDAIGLPYPAIAVMRKHFKQVEKLGVDAPDMNNRPFDEIEAMYAKLIADSPNMSHLTVNDREEINALVFADTPEPKDDSNDSVA